MSNFSQYRLTEAEMRETGVVSAPDRLTGTPQENKAVFDRLVRESVSARFNELLDVLDASAPSLGRGANLLENWYFLCPVNQRGVSGTITAAGYFYDRWLLTSGSVTIQSDGTLTLNGTMEQRFEKVFPGTLTASVLTTTGLNDATAAYDASFSSGSARGRLVVTGTGQRIIAVKLELGDTQTLTRNVGTETNPQWALNDPPPSYQQELEKCQYYYKRFSAQYGWLGSGSVHPNGYFTLLIPKGNMRTNIALSNITINGSIYLFTAGYSGAASLPLRNITVNSGPVTAPYLTVNGYVDGINISNAQAAFFEFRDTASSLEINCEM